MPGEKPSIINMALVGGGAHCKEILEKTTQEFGVEEVNARFKAVVDPDPQSPGMLLAGEMGLITLEDYHELYEPRYDINLIIILTPEPSVFEEILGTRPPHIRILSYHVFEVFWKAICLEEGRLRERTEEMETILNGIQDFILVITPEKKIVDVNEAFLKNMGYTREEVIGRSCHQIFQHVDDHCSVEGDLCALNKAIQNKGISQTTRTRVDPHGEPRFFDVTIFPIWENNGKISKFIEISHDITERKKEEEEITRRLEQMVEERTRQLNETHAKLIHQDKMASLGKLAASVVHELNNPLAGILNMLMLSKRIIEEGPVSRKETDQFVRYLDLMETETRRSSRIVSNLLAFSRQSKMELRHLNLNRIIEQVLVLNSNLLKINGIKVKKKLDPNLPDIVGSEDQLQQVLMNLVSNAAEAMEANGGGVLNIVTGHTPKDGNIRVSFKDTGVGIPQENMSKIFEPFFTTKKKGKGVGLGLSVAYGIIEEHGGSIFVQSKMGKGTTFRVRFSVEPPSCALDRH